MGLLKLLKNKLILFLKQDIMAVTPPVIAVLGVTGVGKSKLAIEIAEKLGTEVISADSMQVYKYLDIITNKVTEEECKGIKHHLLSCVDPEKRYTVVDFRNTALQIVENLLKSGKPPVIVGGTNYYIEALLWNQLVSKESDTVFTQLKRKSENSESFEESEDVVQGKVPGFEDVLIAEEEVKDKTSSDLHSLLCSVDENTASVLHPNDRRKIIRALQVYQQNGKPLSEILSEQRSLGGSPLGGPLRYKNAIVFWLNCDQAELEDRLAKRADQMIERGLAKELIDFHETFTKSLLETGRQIDYTGGIYQAIGYKEFHDWLNLEPQARNTPEGEKLLRDGVQRLNLVTARYAKKQTKWIEKRFLQQHREVPPVYSLDTTNLSLWNSNVRDRAFAILDAHLEGKESPFESVPVRESKRVEQKSFRCEICDKVLVGENQWREHEKGRVHQKLRAKLRKTEAQTNRQLGEGKDAS